MSATADGHRTRGASAPTELRDYLEIRTASPAGFSPDGRSLLIASDLPGTVQAHRLDLEQAEPPVAVAELAALTRFDEPAGAGYLPAPVDEPRLLLTADRGGNERHQLYTAPAGLDAPLTDPAQADALVVDPEHIHRPGGVSRDGRWLAYATNRGDGVAFDTWVRDLTTGEERRVWAAGGWSQPAGFDPTGRRLAVLEMTTRAGDNRCHLLDLDRIGDEPADHDHPAALELLAHDAPASVGAPSWLPDGSAMLLATDVGRDVAGIARVTPDGAWEYVLTGDWPLSCGVDWAGRHVLVHANVDGISRLALHDPDTLALVREIALPDDGVVTTTRFSQDGRQLAVGFSGARSPGEAYRCDVDDGRLTRLTASPCAPDPAGFVAPELVRVTADDGIEVPLFVHRPEGAGPHPVVVLLHGGPESQWRPSFSPLVQYLVASGLAVVAPNVRGSTGYGRAYQHLDDVERRGDVLRDLAAVHDHLAARDDLDADRAALYGGSYGGYLVLLGLTHQPERWAAGVDLVGIASLVTFLERTSAWRRPYREREYGSLADDRELLERLSPLTHVERLVAPLMIVHGANDPRVPVDEARQIHASLHQRGVDSRLLVYDDEGHGLARLDNRLDAYPRIVAFLRQTLGLADGPEATARA